MKCIYCGTDSNYRARQEKGGRCSSCGKVFAFEPKRGGPGITDGWFRNLLERLTGETGTRYTERQLYYAYARHKYRRTMRLGSFGVIGGLIGATVLGVIISLAVGHWLPVVIVVGLSGLLKILSWSRRRERAARPATPLTTLEAFRDEVLGPWTRAHGRPAGLLDPNEEPPRPAGEEPDLGAYSFERVIVTDRRSTAALLVANNVHVEGRAAVLSRDGYPKGRLEEIREMLRRNPELVVIALHDASPRGVRLVRELRTPEWFAGPGITHIDLGLRPRDVLRMRALCLPGQKVDEARLDTLHKAQAEGLLDPEELAFYQAGYVCELEAVPWVGIQRALNHAFAQLGRASLTPDSGDDVGGAPSAAAGDVATGAALGVAVGAAVVAGGAGSTAGQGASLGASSALDAAASAAVDTSGAWADDGGGLGDGGDDGDG